jgi:hypothetical protein
VTVLHQFRLEPWLAAMILERGGRAKRRNGFSDAGQRWQTGLAVPFQPHAKKSVMGKMPCQRGLGPRRCLSLRLPSRLVARTAGLLLILRACAAQDSGIWEPASVEGLNFQTVSTNVLLAWPSDRRESFVVLWRSNAAVETPWIVLTNQLRAASAGERTAFCDVGAATREQMLVTNLFALYRVFVIPDFWFDMNGVELNGGPKHCGEDFLPLYIGTKETDPFGREITLVVDGKWSGEEDAVERINFGTLNQPHWAYSRGFWFKHDLLANGEHILQLQTLLRLNNIVGDWSWTVTVTNAPVRIRVTNDVSFVGSNPLIVGNKCTFVAQSAAPRGNWRFDVHDSKGRLLASKTGRTTNGDIRWTWDLRDFKGHLHDTLEEDPYFAPTLTVWPRAEEIKGGRRLLEINPRQDRSGWWSQRLGHGFVRKPPSPEERMRRFIYSEPLPFEGQTQPRPWRFPSPSKSNRAFPP